MAGSDDGIGLRGFDSFEVTLGDELRGERATMGKSLLDVQRDLRIKAAYVAAIENCDPSVFPNQGFVAGYIRSYARYLNRDPEDVYRRFCLESGFGGVHAGLKPEQRSGGGAKPLAANTSAPFVVRQAGIGQRAAFDVSPSAIASLAVLASLILGLGYAAMVVVENIQRVEIVPVDQTPGALASIGGIAPPGLGAQELELDLAEEAEIERQNTDRDLTRLYQPRELAVPLVVERDGPLVEIDLGQFAVASSEASSQAATAFGQAAPSATVETAALLPFGPPPEGEPVVRTEVTAPQVMIGAQLPAWVRVSLADGTVLFEKTLDKGELYVLPQDGEAPLLRAGMSGFVYLIVGDVAYGPVGSGTGVAKEVSLLADDILATYPKLDALPDALVASLAGLSAPTVGPLVDPAAP